MDQVKVGEILEGRYRIERLLATGGQANVYRGSHLVLDRPVAIKHLKSGMSPEVTARMTRRFEQEARLISALRDPHTITLYDFGKIDDGSLFMVFEFIDGVSLKELLEEEGSPSPFRVARILRQTLSSLQEAHSFGVLHRDIKPANIMLYEHAGRPDQVKLLDFGIAKIVRGSDNFTHESLTGANSLVGTPRYIAPESYQEGAELTGASDIYSLGLVAYELLTGEPAIKGATPVDVFRNHISLDDILLPPGLQISKGLRAIVEMMLRREVEDRYAEVEQILRDLGRWFDSQKRQGYGSGGYRSIDMTLMEEPSEPNPTQALTGAELDELYLPQVEVLPLDEVEIDPMPSIQVEPLNALPEASSASSYPHHTPNPDLETTAERIAREQLNKAIASRRSRLLERPPDEAETAPMLKASNRILNNTANIDARILEDARAKDREPEARDAKVLRKRKVEAAIEGEGDDDTMNVDLRGKLAADIDFSAHRSEASEVLEASDKDAPEAKEEAVATPYAAPHDKTTLLTELPPLKKSAVLKRRRKKWNPPNKPASDD